MKNHTYHAAALLCATLLVGCKDSADETKFPAAPQELAECRFYFLTNSQGSRMNVVRCPNSTTTNEVRSGKTTQTTLVVDSVEYAPKSEPHPK